MPWPSFVNDIKKIQDELLIAHYTKDNMPKQAKRNIRDSKGVKKLTQGDTARASLHNDTYYGAIEKDGEVKYVVRKNLDGLDEKDVKNIVDNEVRLKVENAIQLYGSLKKALEETIWMNEEKRIPIKKVRLFAGSVTRPINIREQRDLSKHEYKRQYHVQNDRNYMMAIYIGKDKKGKEKREFELVNNIEAAYLYRRSNKNEQELVPYYSKCGYELQYKLKIGTMVLLYENSPEEVWELDKTDLQKRLYKVTGMSSMVLQEKYEFGTIELVHHQDARPSTEIKKKNGAFKSGDDFRPGIKMLHTQINALVQNVDFSINDIGEIRRLI
jgi:CRISPR-associated endonuclease Csn1